MKRMALLLKGLRIAFVVVQLFASQAFSFSFEFHFFPLPRRARLLFSIGASAEGKKARKTLYGVEYSFRDVFVLHVFGVEFVVAALLGVLRSSHFAFGLYFVQGR